MARSNSKNLAIVFTDIVGFTERTSHQSRAENQAMLDEFERTVRPLIRHFSGRLLKMIGDACLATFHSPTDAVRCGMAMQDALAARNQDKPAEQQIHIRVAINAGEVRLSGKDVFGEAVNVASRVEGIAPAGEIYLTEAVYLAMNKAEVASESVGTHTLKGIPEPVKVYRVPPRRVVRLVASEESDAVNYNELPYGGMHKGVRLQAPIWMSPRTLRFGLVAVMALVAVGAVLFWTTSSVLVRAEAALAVRNWDIAAQLAQATLVRNPSDAAAVLLQGHVAAGQQRYGDALRFYSQALTLDAGLRNERRLADNLVASLARAPAPATELIRKYPGDHVIAALKRRATEPGYAARHKAIALLHEAGRGKELNVMASATLDLVEGESCNQRLEAVRQLAKSNDQRALPPLKKLLEDKIKGRILNYCLWNEAEQAVQKLEPKKKKT